MNHYRNYPRSGLQSNTRNYVSTYSQQPNNVSPCSASVSVNASSGNGMNSGVSYSCAPCSSLAMVFPPYQFFRNLYEPDEALAKGTLFVDLDKPFQGGCGCGCMR